jgi:hypothetical protein
MVRPEPRADSFRWSFGGNRLQIKTEDKVFSDVLSALRNVADIATQVQGSYKSLQSKQELTQLLIENERTRLRVWLFPLEPERKHHIPSIGGSKNSTDVGSPSFYLSSIYGSRHADTKNLGCNGLSPTCVG